MPFPARGSFTKLGKGSLFLDLFDDNGVPEGLEFLGNANSIAISAEVTDTELYSSTERSGALIARAVLRTSYTLTVSLNEYTLNNLKLFLKGEDNIVQQAAQSQESVQFTVKQGKYYETGFRKIANVTVMQGTDTMVLGTATMSKSVRQGIDFFPLSVDYEERLYAAGRIPGSYFRREGRPSSDAILTSRLTDRPLRPLFPDGMRNEVQVIITTLSSDKIGRAHV